MSRTRRVLASLGAVALALLVFPVSSRAVTPADVAVAADAAAWIVTQQQPDGGFEVAQFPGLETRDAALALAESAQSSTTWSTAEAHAALAALEFGGPGGPTPLHALDAYAADIADHAIPSSAAGAAAKTIVLAARPLGLDPAAFDAAGDGSPVDLLAQLDEQCDLIVFSDILYGMLAGVTLCGDTPADAAARVRAAQQADGGWGFAGDPSTTGFDGDTTGLAVQALVAAGASGDDAAVVAALALAADEQQPDGGWIDFFGTESNASTTSIVALGIEAAGFDVTTPCWRDTVAPERATAAYADPVAWTRSQQAPDGHILSPYDSFGVNTLTTAQSVHLLVLRWFPVLRAQPNTCEPAPPPPPTPPSPPAPPAPPAPPSSSGPSPAAAVRTTPRFTG
jgi:hypothetical protein